MDVQPGLFYKRTDGELIELSVLDAEQWVVTLPSGGGVHLQRYINGRIDEGYRSMDNAEGVVAMVGAILGFEPPRCPIRRDRLAP